MKDVLISITGIQHAPGEPQVPGEDNTIQLVTDGSYQFGDGNCWFSYKESPLTGMEGTTTTFLVKDGLVTMVRKGSVNGEMKFQKGERHCFLYNTPFGAMTMGIRTQRLKTNLDEHGGSMDITYTVDMNEVPLGKNVFQIDVKEVPEKDKGETTDA